MKRCAKCSIEKSDECFSKRTRARDGKASYCKPCQSAFMKAWKASNPILVVAGRRRYEQKNRAALNQKNARWRADNRERQAALVADWERRNPDRVAAKYKRYRERNPEKYKAWQDDRRTSGRRRLANIVRRTAERQAGQLTAESIKARFEFYGFRCRYCSIALTMATVQAEHRIPIARGGLNVPANIVPSCAKCNRRKWTKTEREYLALIGGDGRVDVSDNLQATEPLPQTA